VGIDIIYLKQIMNTKKQSEPGPPLRTLPGGKGTLEVLQVEDLSSSSEGEQVVKEGDEKQVMINEEN